MIHGALLIYRSNYNVGNKNIEKSNHLLRHVRTPQNTVPGTLSQNGKSYPRNYSEISPQSPLSIITTKVLTVRPSLRLKELYLIVYLGIIGLGDVNATWQKTS